MCRLPCVSAWGTGDATVDDRKATIHKTDCVRSKNVEYYNYLGSMMTNDARCTRETECRTAMSKSSFQQ